MIIKLFLLLTLFLISSRAVYPMNIKSNEMQSLKNGDVLFKPVQKNSVNGSETAILINAPLQKVWQVLERKENMTIFIDQIKKATVLSETPDGQLVKTSIKICKILPCFDYVISFDNRNRYNKITFTKTEGCFKELFGCFELIPCEQGTILDCQVFADPGFIIPIVSGNSLKSDVISIMKAIKRQSEYN